MYINAHESKNKRRQAHKQMTQLCSYFEKGRIIRPNRNYTKRSHRVFNTCYSLQLFTKHICTEFSLIAYLIYSSIFTKPRIYSTSDWEASCSCNQENEKKLYSWISFLVMWHDRLTSNQNDHIVECPLLKQWFVLKQNLCRDMSFGKPKKSFQNVSILLYKNVNFDNI